MFVLLMLYPIVMLELLFLNPLTQSLGMAEATFIGNVLSVAATGFLLIPLANRAFEWWLLPERNDSLRVEIGGTALIIGLYALSVTVFAWLNWAPPQSSATGWYERGIKSRRKLKQAPRQAKLAAARAAVGTSSRR